MASYPTLVFIELLNDQRPRITWIRDRTEDGVSSTHYQNSAGNLVMIDTTDETIEENEGREYLRQLLLNDLIEILFP